MKHTERISLTDSLMQAIIKMAEGNPGAAIALADIAKNNAIIDPDSAFAEYSAILGLDSLGIYGTDIYILHNDICDRDPIKTIAIIRAWQLGFLDSTTLKNAAGRQDRSGKNMIPVDALLTKVKGQLPNFGNP